MTREEPRAAAIRYRRYVRSVGVVFAEDDRYIYEGYIYRRQVARANKVFSACAAEFKNWDECFANGEAGDGDFDDD